MSRKKCLFLLLSVLIVSGLVMKESATAQNADWTVMAYLNGDNDLEYYALQTFLELASVGSNSDVRICALLDRIPGHSPSYGDWTVTRRGFINQNDEPMDNWGNSLGEQNMGDYLTLTNFVLWCIQNAPADNYLLVMFCHGNGWPKGEPVDTIPILSMGPDETDGDWLTTPEIGAAFTGIDLNGPGVDIVLIESCLMGMIEVVTEICDDPIVTTKVMVASEHTMQASSIAYDAILTSLNNHPLMSPYDLGDTIVAFYPDLQALYTLASIDLLQSDSLYKITGALADTLLQRWQTSPGECAMAAYRVMEALDDAILTEKHSSGLFPGAHGLAVYHPSDVSDYDTDYSGPHRDFAVLTSWDVYLEYYYINMLSSWVETARANTQEFAYPEHIDLYDFCVQIMRYAPETIWVDFTYSGTEDGSYDQPYNTVGEAESSAAPGETICIRGGATSETVLINQEVQVRAYDGTVRIGQ